MPHCSRRRLSCCICYCTNTHTQLCQAGLPNQLSLPACLLADEVLNAAEARDLINCPPLSLPSAAAASLVQGMLLRRLADVASGLCYLHSRNVCHGDLKCENVLLRTGGSGRRTCRNRRSLLTTLCTPVACQHMDVLWCVTYRFSQTCSVAFVLWVPGQFDLLRRGKLTAGQSASRESYG